MSDIQTQCRLLDEFKLRELFIEHLGWDRHDATLPVPIDGHEYALTAIAQKRGFAAYVCETGSDDRFPDHSTRGRIDTQVTKSSREHLVIYVNGDRSEQLWQWVRRAPGQPIARREYSYRRGQTGGMLIERVLPNISFELEEEDGLSLVDVTTRAKAGFDVEKVTKRFYDRFKTEHEAFSKFLKGIPDESLQSWYVSVMLNRLMFIYFVQKKHFLDADPDYLRHRLATAQRAGKNRYYKHLLCPLFFEGFATQPEDRSPAVNKLLGTVPYLNGGLFLRHQIEEIHGEKIQIADAAFERLFDFFDAYRWHLDERPLRENNEINPDVLGYIFEKYINQKQMGAYYTKEDITGYIAKNTIIPFLFDAARKDCAIAFKPDGALWRLLKDDPDRYIYPAVRHGVDEKLPKEIAAGIKDVSKRGGWNKPAQSKLALPTESWREHVARRQRCEELRRKLTAGEVTEINDFITLNLDIRQFAEDVIVTSEGPELVRAFWKAVERVTVLDPACGSGAFLFAALNILEPLYEACLNRMEGLLDELSRSGKKHSPMKFADFRQMLERIAQHPNHRYFILKSIMVNNLFGVDIMEEATEICKLRLFLKLVAQVERVEQLEPLPDIDFNIRAGNTLIGFTSLAGVKTSMEGRFDFGNDIDTIEDQARQADTAFKKFREMQTDHDVSAAEVADGKRVVRERMGQLEGELDRYLAGEYGIDPDKPRTFTVWKKSHEPFHWFVDFYGIMAGGGFDVIIGNPPYIELKQVTQYAIRGYHTTPAGNLYAPMIERGFTLSPPSGRLGFIVPVSSISTDRYAPLQQLITQRRIVYSSYDDRPSRLFEGIEHARLTVHIFGKPLSSPVMHSTRYNKWSSHERPGLFPGLVFTHASGSLVRGSLPKLCADVEHSIIEKLSREEAQLCDFLAKSAGEAVFYSRKIGYFLQVLDFEPRVLDGRGRRRPPSEFKTITFVSRNMARCALACLNSNLFYWFVTVFSDCRHVNKREVNAFPIHLRNLADSQAGADVTKAVARLMKDLDARSEHRNMTFRHDSLTVQCIIPRLSKSLIDEIDRMLAKHYDFTDEELDYIINYDIKYRMGGSDENGS